MSRLHRVCAGADEHDVDVEDLDGTVHRVSLLALEGPPPEPGEWLVVHSGYALERVDAAEAQAVLDDVRRAMAGAGPEGPRPPATGPADGARP